VRFTYGADVKPRPTTLVRIRNVPLERLDDRMSKLGATRSEVVSALLAWFAAQPIDVQLAVVGAGRGVSPPEDATVRSRITFQTLDLPVESMAAR